MYHRITIQLISTNLPNANSVIHIEIINIYLFSKIYQITIQLITLKCKCKQNLRYFRHTITMTNVRQKKLPVGTKLHVSRMQFDQIRPSTRKQTKDSAIVPRRCIRWTSVTIAMVTGLVNNTVNDFGTK